MAHVRIKLIGAESSRSYFQIDGCGRYDMRDGIAFSIPDGWHTLQAVQVIYDAFSPKEENGEICIPFSVSSDFQADTMLELRIFLHADGCIIDMECDQINTIAKNISIREMQN